MITANFFRRVYRLLAGTNVTLSPPDGHGEVTVNSSGGGGGGTPTSRQINTTAPLTGGGDFTADRTLSIPASTIAVDGYLKATDFTIFNTKVGATRTINTTAPLTGGGDLSADRTLSIPAATDSVDGYLSAADHATFAASAAGGAPTSRQINTTAPLTGGGDLTANRTLDISLVTNSTKGVVPALVGVDGAVPTDDGLGNIANRRLTQDDIDAAFSITSFSPTFSTSKELGDTITNPAFTASYNATLTTPLTINDGTNTDTITLSAQASFGYNNGGASGLPARSYSLTAINSSKTWTLSAKKLAGPTKTRNTSASWYPRAYFDITTVPGAFDAAFITGLAQSRLQSGFGGGYALGAGSVTKKIYLAWPTAFGNPSSFKDQGGFSFPMSKVASAVAVTNSFSVVVAGGYDIWASDNFIVPATTITVT